MSANTVPLPLSPRLVGYFRRTRAEVSAAAFKLAFAMLVVASAFGATYVDAESLFTSTELRETLALGAFVSGVQLLGVLIALRSRTAANAALALVTLVGVFTAYVVHTDLFQSGSWAALMGICGAGAFALFVAFRIVDERRLGGILLSAAALAVVGVIVGPALASSLLASGELQSGARKQMEVEARNIRPLEFLERPNVYFVGFDSLVPKSIMQNYLGIESTDVHELFDSEARRFRNFFANADSTKAFFNTLLSLDEAVLDEGYKGRRGYNPRFFSGQSPSPLVEIMKDNGYETTSIFNDAYFGYPKGPYIDNYMVQSVERGVCPRLDDNVQRLAFWRYCRLSQPHIEQCPRVDDAPWRWGPWAYCKAFGFLARGVAIPRGDYLVRQLTGIDGDKPQFVIAHLFMPGHASKDRTMGRDRAEAFVRQYQRQSDKAAVYMRQIIDHVRSSDPEAILFIFGDHGTYFSGGISFEEAPNLFVHHRFAVLGGVYPRDRCAKYLDEVEGQGYMTTLDAVHAILKCLSGGQSALVVPTEHKLRVVTAHDNYLLDPREFLYE